MKQRTVSFPWPPTTHKTMRTAIKTEDIDTGIVGVVKWLNSFESVYTLQSCQGEDGDGDGKPYVLFHCGDPTDLIKILDEAHTFATMQIEWYQNSFRYNLRFVSVDTLAVFDAAQAIVRQMKRLRNRMKP